MKKPARDTFEKIAMATGGSLSDMARRLGCSRSTVYNWIEKDEKFKEIVDDVRESMLDLTESQMMRLIRGVPKYDTVEDSETGEKTKRLVGWDERPDSTLIMFHLKTRGKKRGYDQNSPAKEEGAEKPGESHAFTLYDPATKETIDFSDIGAAKEEIT